MIPESPTEMNITSGVFHQANEKQNYILMKTRDSIPVIVQWINFVQCTRRCMQRLYQEMPLFV